MSTRNDTDMQAWIDEAKNADILSVAQRLQPALRRNGVDWNGPCPLGCCKTDGFVVTPGRQLFNCRQSGAGGGVIDMAMHCLGTTDFLVAVEEVTQRSNPATGVSRGPSDEDRQRQREEADRMRQKREADEARQSERKLESAKEIWSAGSSMSRSSAEKYLASRGLVLPTYDGVDLRSIEALPYWGYRDANSQGVELLGHFPAMLGAIRSLDGALIGVHRTFIQPDHSGKLVTPGDQRRNKAKKIEGEVSGGMIRLSYLGETLASGEGIETTFSYRALERNAERDISIAAGVSLGNMRGGCTGGVPHPKASDGKAKNIPNGIPDPEKPGMGFPSFVKTFIALGDGDSDHPFTVASILACARRAQAQGIEAMVDFANAGEDFNNEMRRELAAAVGAAA
jgi:hypothetical protein